MLFFNKKQNVSDFPYHVATECSEAIQSLCYNNLNYPSKKQADIFKSYISMANIAYHFSCRNILEIGAGLSTVVWANFARATGAKVFSIDINFSQMFKYVENSEHKSIVREHINFIESATINSSELIRFYSGDSKDYFCGIRVSDFADMLDLFQRPHWLFKKVNKVTSKKIKSIRDLIIFQSSLTFPVQLLNIYSANKNFEEEIEFLRNAEKKNKKNDDRGICYESEWDMIFFDSGEFSSMIEWSKLKDKISIGGLAAFHDIFFPKSLKNCVVCASLLADSNWKVIYVDDSDSAGLMIAQRLG